MADPEDPRKSNSAKGRRSSAPWPAWPEPDLVMLLADPGVRLLMRADHVDERALVDMLDRVSVERRQHAATDEGNQRSSRHSDPARYRPGVGIMLLNKRGDVFVARRADVGGEAWQMPQGGIEDGESPRQAALRELKEEIGTNNVKIIAESNGWFYYDVPNELAQTAWGGRWLGQRQKWFAMVFKGADSEIDVDTSHPEFDAWRWLPVNALSQLAVSFKHQLYRDVLGEFATILRDWA